MEPRACSLSRMRLSMGRLRLHWLVHSSKSTSSNSVVSSVGSSSGRCRRCSANACAHPQARCLSHATLTPAMIPLTPT